MYKIDKDRVIGKLYRGPISRVYRRIQEKRKYESYLEEYEQDMKLYCDITDKVENNWVSMQKISYELNQDFHKTELWKIFNHKKLKELRNKYKTIYDIKKTKHEKLNDELSSILRKINLLELKIEMEYNNYIKLVKDIDILLDQLNEFELEELIQYLKITIESTNDNYFNAEEAMKIELRKWFNIENIKTLEGIKIKNYG